MTEQEKEIILLKGGSRKVSTKSEETQMLRSNTAPAADSWIWSVPNFEMTIGSVRRREIASSSYENETVDERGSGWADMMADQANWFPLLTGFS